MSAMDPYQQRDDIAENLVGIALVVWLVHRYGDNTAVCVGMYLLLWYISGGVVLPAVTLACAAVAYGIYQLCRL